MLQKLTLAFSFKVRNLDRGFYFFVSLSAVCIVDLLLKDDVCDCFYNKTVHSRNLTVKSEFEENTYFSSQSYCSKHNTPSREILRSEM
jgi:hypothetical protein